jgi:hypothetical protein
MRHLKDADEQKDTGNAESTKFSRVSLELVEEVRAHDVGQDVHRVPQAPFHSVRPAKKHFTKQAADAVESHANLGISGSRLGSSLPLPTGRRSASSCAAPGLVRSS